MSAGFRPDLALVIAHPDDEVRQRLIAELTAPGSGVVVVGLAATAAPAHSVVRRMAPDVALLATARPVDGVAITRALQRELPACRVLLIAETDDEPSLAGLDAGALGCLPSDRPPRGTLDAVRGVARGEAILTPRWARALLDRPVPDGGREPDPTPGADIAGVDIAGVDIAGVDSAGVDIDATDAALLAAIATGLDLAAAAAEVHLTPHAAGRRTADVLARVTRHREPVATAGG